MTDLQTSEKGLPEGHEPDLLPEDEGMEATKAPLLEHLNELRARLIWCIVALVVAAGLSFAFALPIYNWLIQPFADASEAAGKETQMQLIFTGPLEFFFVKIKLALFAGLFLACLLYTSPSPRDQRGSRMPSSA